MVENLLFSGIFRMNEVPLSLVLYGNGEVNDNHNESLEIDHIEPLQSERIIIPFNSTRFLK